MGTWLEIIFIVLFLNGIAAILIGLYLPGKDEPAEVKKEEEAL